MRILFLTHRAESPSARWRVGQFIPHLEALGARVNVEPISRRWAPRSVQWLRAFAYDVVVLQKRLLGPVGLWSLRRAAHRLVFEFDDAIPLGQDGEKSISRPARFARTLRACDAATTSNEYLADLTRAHLEGKPVGVFPNAIDAGAWSPREGPGDGLVVGWNGSSGNFPHLAMVLPALRAVAKRHPGLRLRVVSDRPFAAADLEVEHVAYDPATEPEEVRRFDIGIAPLPDDAWTRGKCPVKVLTYFAAGVPVAASDSPAHRCLVRNDAGLLCAADGWEEALERLVSDRDLRARMGAAGCRAAETEFDARSTAARMLAFYESLAKARRSLAG